MAENFEHVITVEPPWEKHSVFKLPPHITSVNTNAFKPIVISFGPYHYNENHLKPMEAHKLRSLERFLNITKKTLEDIVHSFEEMKQQLMDHYEQLGDEWKEDGNRFLELMVRDGCFMLDILLSTTEVASAYNINNPIFGRSTQSNVMCQNIKRDMLLIENQLPLLVLENLIDGNMEFLHKLTERNIDEYLKKLAADNKAVLEKLKIEKREDRIKLTLEDITVKEFIRKQIHELILKFLESYEVHIQSNKDLCLHTLDVFRENMIQRRIERRVLSEVTLRANFPPATALSNNGVTFKRNSTSSFIDITFENWVLTLPHIFIDKETEPIFLNLMAFERFQAGKGQEVSAYIDFMDSLVRSAKDVSLLRSREIIATSRESDEVIATLFHKLAENQIVDPDDSLDGVRQSLANFIPGESQKWEKQSVFKLPPHITSLNTNAFKPNVISFGPYHYNEHHLKPMEAQKLRSFNRFLKSTNTTRQHLVQSFKPMEQQLMDHYDELGDEWRHGDFFLELMIRDGCFMLDILQTTAAYTSEYNANDPVFGRSAQSNAMYHNIERDMLLIENQLPLLVLKKLIAHNKVVLDKLKVENITDRTKMEEGDMTEAEFIHKQIHELILKFLESYEVHIQSNENLCLHALDVFRENMIQRPMERRVLSEVTLRANFPPATALSNNGVTFKRNNTSSFMDITFEDRVLTLPHIFIDKETETIFLNLMAFERFQAGKGQEVSAYIDFMDSLVRSAEDVSLLRSREIIATSRESDEVISTLFHKLAENQIVDPDGSLDGVRQSLANFIPGESQKWENQSVFKLPPHITSLNTNAFKPNVISFGPYHYNEQHLKLMEAHKLRSFNHYLNITNTTPKQLLQSFEPKKQQLMNYYGQLGSEWKDGDEFLELMIRDGCFMLDILRNTAGYASEYCADHPVFGRSAQSNDMLKDIKRDMLLIENQLPLLVLKKLIADNMEVFVKLIDGDMEDWKKVMAGYITLEEFIHEQKRLKAGDIEDFKKWMAGQITEEEFIHKKIHDLTLKFLESYKMHIQSHINLCLHPLDVFRENMFQRPIMRLVSTKVTPRANIQSATTLRYTGITFKKNDTFNFMDITFKDRVLTLPRIFIDKQTEPTFLNLMAFDRFQAGKGQEVSAYIDFMGSLVRSSKDVRLLRKKMIIATSRDSDEEIVKLFQDLAKNQIINPDDSLDEVRQSLCERYNKHSWWGRCIEMLAESGSIFKDTYCKNLLTATGLIAGTIILVLAFTQTIYAVRPKQ